MNWTITDPPEVITEPDEYERAWKMMDTIVKQEINDPGFTTAEIAERYGLTPNVARHRLENQMAAGKLVAGWKRLPNGRKVRVYRPVE